MATAKNARKMQGVSDDINDSSNIKKTFIMANAKDSITLGCTNYF